MGTGRSVRGVLAFLLAAGLVSGSGPVAASVAGGDPDARDPEGDGSWGPVLDFTIMPIHSMVLPDGKVLTFGTDEAGDQGGQFVHTLYDPATDKRKVIPNTTGVNIFCSNMVIDPATGEVVIMGGDQYRYGGAQWSGIRDSVIFDPVTETIRNNERGDLNFARWYGTVNTLSNGEIFMVGGRDERFVGSTVPEIYNSSTGFRTLPGAAIDDFLDDDGSLRGTYWYTHSWQASDGDVWVIESEGGGAERSDMHRVDVRGQGSVQTVGRLPFDTRNLNASVMFDVDKVAIAANDGWIWVGDLAPTVPTWTRAVRMENARTNGYLVPLPDGRVAAVGGSSDAGLLGDSLAAAQKAVLVWDPATNTTERWAQSTLARMYHSSSILLPDATIMAGGGGAPGPLNNRNAEIFTPPYLFDGSGRLADRPLIAGAPSNISAGSTFRITVDDAESVAKVSAIRSGAATHGRNADARYLALDATVVDGRTIEITSPTSAVMPPGLWMLFTVDANGVPSLGHLLGVDMVDLPEAQPLDPPATIVYGIDNEQIDGAFQATVDVRFDDVDAGAGARVFEFSNGPRNDTIWLGQVGATTGMRFAVVRDGVEYAITAPDVIREGQIQRWTVSVARSGAMRLYRGADLVAQGQGAVPADVDRRQNRIGTSNEAPGAALFGLVRNLQITNLGPGQEPTPPGEAPPPPPPAPEPRVITSLPTTAGDDDIVLGDQVTLTGTTFFGAGRNRLTTGRYFTFTGAYLSMNGSTAEATMNFGFGANLNGRPIYLDNGGDVSTVVVDGYSKIGQITMIGGGTGTGKRVTLNTNVATTGDLDLDGSGTIADPLELTVTFGRGVDVGGEVSATGVYSTKTLVFDRNVNINTNLNLTGGSTTVTATIGDGLRVGGYVAGSTSGTDRFTIGDGWSIGSHLDLAGGDDTLTLGEPADGTRARIDGGPGIDTLTLGVHPDDVASFRQAAAGAGWTSTGATTWNAAGRTLAWSGLSLEEWETVTVVVTNLAPVVTNPGPLSTLAGQPVDLLLSAVDPEGAPLTWSAQDLPIGLTIDAATGTISGTPVVPGVSSVIVGASDGRLGGTVTFDWTVTAAAGPTTVGGRITESGGGPAAGVVVDLFGADGEGRRSMYLRTVTTGDDGRFAFDVSANACYYTVAIAPNGRTFTTASRWAERSACVTEGETRVGLDAQLSAQRVITRVGGDVSSEIAGPVAGVTVDLFTTTADGARAAYLTSTTTDATGSYGFDVEPGCYWLVFIGPAGEAFVNGRTFDGVSYVEAPACVAAGEQDDTVDAELIGSAGLVTIVGSVTRGGAGVGGVTIDLFEAGADGTRTRWLGEGSSAPGDGRFDFPRAGGCYVVVAIAPIDATFEGGGRYAERAVCLAGGAPAPVEFRLA